MATPINIDRIDFISAYCDSWCERCAFTSRCSSYAVRIALTMCDGDFRAALELAVGAPPPRDPAEVARREAFLEELQDYEPTEAALAETIREEEGREERLDESPVTTAAERFSVLAADWVASHHDQFSSPADAQLAEAWEIVSWDTHLIAAKLHRALHGRDEFMRGEGFEDDPIQNDWNGSAKVALISIERSLDAWAGIAAAFSDSEAAAIAGELRQLKDAVECAFPGAWKFIRPGFDQQV
jgi:hypothetical protein